MISGLHQNESTKAKCMETPWYNHANPKLQAGTCQSCQNYLFLWFRIPVPWYNWCSSTFLLGCSCHQLFHFFLVLGLDGWKWWSWKLYPKQALQISAFGRCRAPFWTTKTNSEDSVDGWNLVEKPWTIHENSSCIPSGKLTQLLKIAI